MYSQSAQISIHAPRRGSDSGANYAVVTAGTDFNPRSPQGERLDRASGMIVVFTISIHAPRRGSDRNFFDIGDHAVLFQSTLPAGGATCHLVAVKGDLVISIHAPRRGSDREGAGGNLVQRISIHAPRRGSDPVMAAGSHTKSDFNPRSPQGERQGV